jgi:hypothetical protein
VAALTRFAALVAAAAFAAVGAEGARAPLDVRFDSSTTRPGDRVTVRTLERATSSPGLARLYLVRTDLSERVRSRMDSRLHFIGFLRPARTGRGALTFTVPALDSGTYGAAYSRGRMFSVVRRSRLTVAAPPATAESCPVSTASGPGPPGIEEGSHWYGNGALWAVLPPGGVFYPREVDVKPDGSLWTKLFWYAARVDGVFFLSGRRLDAPSPPLRVHRVNRGWQTNFRGSATWATPVSFPTVGCWKLRARVQDVTLSFVISVVRA